ncbi:TetR/AcrR family transcriptional regulator [Streptomyces sp. TS71-3]|uniref:TetR/AcrR family transcriptional regulator n=1 Tax=Streptomyces sp. TS71-3 TaxID=2733862 RepID=UPI001B0D4CA7|nr:TetR/AcrR family transcriptional regulator [Streptomyces sp. TS71-3]GHJ42166.1 hypothetical protein Sm713_77750 [Streptomyces sp. TS71-3]
MAAESPGRTGRAYRSPRRAQAAEETHARILDAARRLFLEHGYAPVTVGDIARAAGTAVPTVYASTGGKAAVLATIIDAAVRDPIVEHTLAEVRAAADAREAVRRTAHGVRTDNERYHDVVRVMVTAAATDESAAETLAAADADYRAALADVAAGLDGRGALRPGLALGKATDILWFLLGHQAWHLYVAELGWSWDEAERWLGEQAAIALLAPDPSG